MSSLRTLAPLQPWAIIADEVKTIEVGLVLREIVGRDRAQRVLIVVPSADAALMGDKPEKMA